MGIDPRIILGLQSPNIKQPDALDEVTKAITLKNLLQQGNLHELQYNQLKETQPLDLEKRRLDNERMKRISALIASEGGTGGGAGGVVNEGAPMGAGGISTPGGGQANMQSGQTMPPLPSNVPPEMAGFAHDVRVAKAISLDDPAKGRALMEAIKLKYPEIKWEGGIPLHPRTGLRMAGAPIIPHVNQQGFATTANLDPNTNQVSIATTPGAAGAYGEQQRIGERAKADFDLITRPPTGPGVPPAYMSRSQALGMGGPAAQPTPAPQPAPIVPPPAQPLRTNAPNEAAALAMAQQADVQGRQFAIGAPADPSSAGLNRPLVPGIAPSNAAGMSPQQQATADANKEFQVTDAKHRAELYFNMQKGAMDNQPKIAKLQRIGSLLGDFSGGRLAPAGLELARLGTSLGVQIDPNLPNKEAANALSNEVALELRNTASGAGMPGAMSDSDREFLKSMTPQLAQTAEGRKLVIESRVSVMRRDQQIAEMARKYKQKHGAIDEDFFSQLQGWSNRNPIFNNASR